MQDITHTSRAGPVRFARSLALVCVFAPILRARQTFARPTSPSQAGNVLLVIADDVGTDKIGAYREASHPPPTPAIDALAARGVLFRHAYAEPLCSPTRATIMTGRYGFRTLIGEVIPANSRAYSLPFTEVTLPALLGSGPRKVIATALIGKWHLSNGLSGGALAPNLHGFDWFSGTLCNFAAGETFCSYTKTTNGEQTTSTVYATTDQVDDALAWITAAKQPWFCVLSFNAPHAPMHVPPPSLHSCPLAGDPENTPVEHFDAALEALDIELGRLLTSLAPKIVARTNVIVLGDNGTPPRAVAANAEGKVAKGSLFEGGVHVPLIIAGPCVVQPGRECGALVNTVDLFPTIADLFGVNVAESMPDARKIDGMTLMPYILDAAAPPQRHWVFAERFEPNGPGPYTSRSRMLRDERWKLIERDDARDQFFDLQDRALEEPSLLPGDLTPEQRRAYDTLKTQMLTLLHS